MDFTNTPFLRSKIEGLPYCGFAPKHLVRIPWRRGCHCGRTLKWDLLGGGYIFLPARVSTSYGTRRDGCRVLNPPCRVSARELEAALLECHSPSSLVRAFQAPEILLLEARRGRQDQSPSRGEGVIRSGSATRPHARARQDRQGQHS